MCVCYEFLYVNHSYFLQGTGCSIQPQNPTPSSEDVGSSVSEPPLTTGDALDKYRIILEKVQ